MQCFFLTLVAVVVACSHATKLTVAEGGGSKGNPIRKVLNLMEKLAEKIEKEGEKEEKLYEKFECYCKKTKASLEKSIADATQSPITQADIDAVQAEITSLEDAVAKIKSDQKDEEDALQSAAVQRNTSHVNFVEEVTEEEDIVNSIAEAEQALGSAAQATLLQRLSSSKQGAKLLRALDGNLQILSDDKRKVAAFLQGQKAAQPDSDYVTGQLEALKDDTMQEINTENTTEIEEVKTYNEVKDSKETSIHALLETYERKIRKIGELKLDVANMKRRMSEQGNSLEDDQRMLAELEKSCAEKAKDWDARKAARSEELVGLQDTVKLLSADDSLDLFRKRSTSLLQLATDRKAVREAQQFIRAAKDKDSRPQLNFLVLSLSGKKADFSKVIKKIDGLVELVDKEQKDDDAKKEYCEEEFRKNAAKTKDLKGKVKALEASIEDKAPKIKKLAEEIKALQDGVKEIDEDVAQAGDNRKEEHQDYQESMSEDSTAIELLKMARDRLYKVYHPEFASTTTTKSPYDMSFLQMAAKNALSFFQAPSNLDEPPPTFSGDYKQSDGSAGILKIMDTMIADIEKEVLVAEREEKNAQKEYEETVADAAKKREADLVLASSKTSQKADMESDLHDDTKQVKGEQKQVLQASEYLRDLHTQCDWDLQNFDLRKEARAAERENLVKAKVVLGNM
eukprot:TRINITY_DN17929_c0_g2_i2.p1 TRINITY_DN17929_c0_g2~~TRINITY_DN17929_c0_g2_i2.p1  ORF type:complete len:682 (-),score=230.45 TRINITY_DN17929_c0_g2_i2:60-2105(-)